ncbi:MAG: hypothetical protein IJF49_07125 [Clostridia bacterium]|nr:hypothetical protein [Clostridia bacterium]
MRHRILFLSLIVLLCLYTCVSASANNVFYYDGISVQQDVDPVENPVGMVDLGLDDAHWKNIQGQTLSRISVTSDADPAQTRSMHTIQSGTVLASFSPSAELEGNQTLAMYFKLNTEREDGGSYYLNFRLYAGDYMMVTQTRIPAGTWCLIEVDIGSWAYRSALNHVEMQVNTPDGLETVEMQFSSLFMDERMDEEIRERFMTDTFAVRGGEISMSPDEDEVYLVPTDNSPIVEAEVLPPSAKTELNALRLVLNNESACSSLTLQYAYRADGANARSVTAALGSGKQTLLFEIERVSELRYLRFVFTGAREGMITLQAVNAVSVYDSGLQVSGEIDSCTLNEAGNEIVVRGTVAHNIMIANREHKLALFAIQPWETVEDVLTDGREPIAVADMSIRYHFVLPISSGDYAAMGATYLVALQAIEEDGDVLYMPLALPASPSAPYTAQRSSEDGARKGVQTELVSTAGQAGASIYLVNIYLDVLCDGSASGYLYIRGDKSYYFNREVLSALDREVKLRSAAGAEVYLRFLLSDSTSNVIYTLADEGEESRGKRGILLSDADVRDRVGAITEFLTAHYAEGTDYGTVAGIVVGEQIDDAAQYNDIGVYSLSDYVDHYADLLTLIANVGRLQNPALKVIVPISDRRPAVCITSALLESSYDSELFLRSLFMRLDALGGPDVSLMLESMHNPFSLSGTIVDDPTIDASIESGSIDYYNADNLSDFSALLDSLSSTYRSMPDTFFYFWSPPAETESALSAAYAYLYYCLRFSTHAEAFIVSFAEAETAGDMSGMRSLRYLMKYIDTERSLEVSEPALRVLGVDAWTALIQNFDASRLAINRYIEGELTESTVTPTGRYCYWDFSTLHSTRGWYAGALIPTASVKGGGESRALVGEFDRSNAEIGEYCELIYRFTQKEPLGILDRVTFDLMIEGDGVWEICIFVGDTHTRIEQKCVVESGKRVLLALNPADLGDVGVDYIKLCAKPISGTGEGSISLYSVWGESDTLEDDVLSGTLDEARSNEQTEDDTRTEAISPWLLVLAAVLIVSAAIAVWLGRKSEE